MKPFVGVWSLVRRLEDGNTAGKRQAEGKSERERARQAWRRVMRRSRVRCRQITGSPQGPELGICQASSSATAAFIWESTLAAPCWKVLLRGNEQMQRNCFNAMCCHGFHQPVHVPSRGTYFMITHPEVVSAVFIDDRSTMMIVNGRIFLTRTAEKQQCFESCGKTISPKKIQLESFYERDHWNVNQSIMNYEFCHKSRTRNL